MAQSATPRDSVLLYLISVNLTDHENAFRGLLQVAGAAHNPVTRHFTIAAMALMLQMSQIPLQVIMTVVNCLKDQSDDQLKDGLVAILNGSHIVVSKGPEANTMFLIDTLQVVDQQPKYLLTSSMYFVKNVWQQADDILKGRA
jgi:hypothetical protein